jgi:hypothetical protein
MYGMERPIESREARHSERACLLHCTAAAGERNVSGASFVVTGNVMHQIAEFGGEKIIY